MKVVVVGCTHAGTAAVVNIKALYKDCEVTVYERNNNISFLSCGIALNVGGVVEDTKQLFYNSPEGLEKLGVKTCMEHEVLSIDFKTKSLRVENLTNGEIFEDYYDKLVLTLGSWPIIPPIEGIEQEDIVLCKNYEHAQRIIQKTQEIKNVVVIGAGYIRVELAEAFEMKEKTLRL